MDPEIRGSSCPLCKRPMTVAEAATTRLCANCQEIVRNILPTNGDPFPDKPNVQQHSIAPVPTAAISLDEKQHIDPVNEIDEPIAFGSGDLHDVSGFDPDTTIGHEMESAPIKIDIGAIAGNTPPPVTARLKKGALESVLRDSGSLRPTAVAEEQPSLLDEFQSLRRNAGVTEASANMALAVKSNGDSPNGNAVSTDLKVETTQLVPSRAAGNRQPLGRQQQTSRPVSDLWDLKADDWPVLVDNAPKTSSGKWKVVTAVALLLVVVAAVAVSYLVVVRPKLAGASAQSKEEATQKPAAPSRSSTVAAATPPTAEPSKPSPAQQSAATPAAPKTDPQQAENSNARYSLQAASMPSAGGANEFAEKLIRAGVPAYVVAADIPGRGRWYRVRVGRFNSQEDATRFAADAKLRAKTAGISLTLVPCDYEKSQQ